MKYDVRRQLLGTTLIAGGLLFYSAPVMAQSATTPHAQSSTPICPDGTAVDVSGNCPPVASTRTGAATSSSTAEGADIVVTGSLIPKRNATSGIEPLTVLTKQDLIESGYSSTADALQSVAITQGTSQINNAYGGYVVNGGTGTNTIGLRGLGAARTLVLLNGHRLDPSGTQGSVVSADLNVLPTAIVNRIEVLKAGASSIYGSDAVAGVINILTDTNLKGIVVQGQVNVPQSGAGVEKTLSASFGYTGDRLKLIGSAEYNERDPLTLGDVSFSKCPIEGLLTGQGTAFGSGDPVDPATGKPRCFTINNGGVTFDTLGLPARTAIGATSGTAGRFNRFRPNSAITTGLIGFEGVGTFDRTSFDERLLDAYLVTPQQKYTGFVQASYQLQALGDAELYVELLGSQRHSSTNGLRQLTLDYPQGSPLLAAISASTGQNIQGGAYAAPTNTTNGANIAARAFLAYGDLSSEQRVSFVRAAAGIRGGFFFDKWKYDLYVSKSFDDGTYGVQSFLIDRLAKSFDVVQTSPGVFACRSATTGSDPNCVAAPQLSSSVIAGNLPAAYRSYIQQNVVGHTQFREFDASFNINGPLFKLPGGDASLALGAEYRSQRINDQPGGDSIAGNLLNYSSATPTVGSDNVKEAFGELLLPLLADVPFAYRLTLDGSARYTDYHSYGSNKTYKVQGEYQPFKWIGFRASYGTSYRAPALAEQFVGATSGFLSGSSDPCDDYRNSSNPIIIKNCSAVGLPSNDPTTPGNFHQNNGVTVLSVGGAATGLKAETSTNLSAGVVIQAPLPSRFGTLSLSADYFNIHVNNGVNQLDAGTILNLCYGSANFDPAGAYCRLAARDGNGGLTVTTSYLNISTDIRRGYELNLDYLVKVGPGRLQLQAEATKYLEQSTRLFAGDPTIDANGTIGEPDWTGSFAANYSVENVRLHYGLDWIHGDSTRSYVYAATDSSTGIAAPADVAFYKSNYFWQVPDYFLHNASITFSLEKFNLTVGARNLLDTKPPSISYGYTNLAAGNAPLYSGYDYFGRTFFVNVTAKF